MEALIIYPENKEQLVAVKAVMKAMKINFKKSKESLPDEVVSEVKKSLKQAENGKLKAYKGIKEMLD
ncbi:MAG: hypothetical protein REI78_10355 [Pedobacter sp.]|nr:hypothetical protein [Pedobacter sp.]MDQ8053419.1 hypothetical protein [Pedobacter sp.]